MITRPALIWKPISGVFYRSHPVYRNPRNEDLACEIDRHLVALPASIETAIRGGQRGHLG